jgi:rRNA maturation endonuclease Nob1
MGLFGFLFGSKLKCDGCGDKFEEVLGFQDKELCQECFDSAVAAKRRKEEEIEARRAAEELARQKLEDSTQWGSDSRFRD